MEGRAKTIESRKNRKIKISVIPGHFATNHSHINNYIDMTKIKTSHMMAKDAASQIASTYSSTPIDTIICMEGTEMLGAFLAESLASGGINQGEDVAVITPELNSTGQLIFRDNIQKMIWGKRVLLLISSVSTGKTINRALECLNYYSGELVAIASIFSAFVTICPGSSLPISTEQTKSASAFSCLPFDRILPTTVFVIFEPSSS